MALIMTINGFKLQWVNGYAPTDCDGTENQKNEFYRTLRKACEREKKQKIIITGDFNATTSVSLSQSYFDGNQVIIDPICNDNGSRIKSLCRSSKLCMIQTYFDYPINERYTWYSGDKKTKKVLDYVLVEPFVQQYIKDCRVCQELDFESDHRLIVTSIETPKTKKARRKQRREFKKKKLDVNALKNAETAELFVQEVTRKFTNEEQQRSTADTSSKIVNTLHAAAEAILPACKAEGSKEMWRNDGELNTLLKQRILSRKDDAEYIRLTRLVKKRVKFLRNEKIRLEAQEINDKATRRQVEQLYRLFKSGDTSFTDIKTARKCDPSKLKEHFKKHFTAAETNELPYEFIEIPDFISDLRNIPAQELKSGPPDEKELLDVIRNLKDGKSSNNIPIEFIKYSLGSKDFISEMIKLFKSIWETNAIPSCWGHSKLIALWKGPSKGKVDDPKTYRGLQIGSSLCKILIVIILNRLKAWYESQLTDQQQGFRSGRGTTDGIYVAKRVQQITDKMKKPTFVLFVDLTAAFDHVERSWLFKSIHQRLANGLEKKLIKLIESLYSYTTTALSDTPDDIFELKTGVSTAL